MNAAWLEPHWPAPAGVRALSTMRSGGVSLGAYASLNLARHVGDEPAAVVENRRRLAAAARLPDEPWWLDQVHGIEVTDLDAAAPGRRADAAVTRRANRICAILTADCLPVLFAADGARAVGAAHAGWRGLSSGVLEATVQALGSDPGSLMAWIGPCIGPRHFEIGPEVRDALLERDPQALAAFEPNARGRTMANLPLLARRRLAACGIERIYGGEHCTHGDAARFYSHRRDGATGRQATLIWLEGPESG